eukprot:jgi/Mesvir1/10159/Mv02019-RA.1
MTSTTPTDRAMAIALRTYHRPIDVALVDGKLAVASQLESWSQVVDRVIAHQRWLWIRAKEDNLDRAEVEELEELRHHILNRWIAPARPHALPGRHRAEPAARVVHVQLQLHRGRDRLRRGRRALAAAAGCGCASDILV